MTPTIVRKISSTCASRPETGATIPRARSTPALTPRCRSIANTSAATPPPPDDGRGGAPAGLWNASLVGLAETSVAGSDPSVGAAVGVLVDAVEVSSIADEIHIRDHIVQVADIDHYPGVEVFIATEIVDSVAGTGR